MKKREQHKYPPVNRIIKNYVKHKDYNNLTKPQNGLPKDWRNALGIHVLGPELHPSPAFEISNINVLIKIPTGQSLVKTKKSIRR